MNGTVEVHNERAAAVWSAGGRHYEEVSRGIADAIEHAVLRLAPQRGQGREERQRGRELQ